MTRPTALRLASASMFLAMLFLCTLGGCKRTCQRPGGSGDLDTPSPVPIPAPRVFGHTTEGRIEPDRSDQYVDLTGEPGAGSGPSGKIVRLRNRTGRRVRSGLKGLGSPDVDGEPTEASNGRVGPTTVQIKHGGEAGGSEPGTIASGTRPENQGYKEVSYTPGYLHPSMKITGLSLTGNATFYRTDLAPFYVELPTGHQDHFNHLWEVEIEVHSRVDDVDGLTYYYARYKVAWSRWDTNSNTWDDTPTGSPSGWTNVGDIGVATPRP